MAKTKMTGFARLLIFLLIFLPLAFFGASYINGEDPVARIKSYLGQGGGETTSVSTPAGDNDRYAGNDRTSSLEKRIKDLERDLAVKSEELARCKFEQSSN